MGDRRVELSDFPDDVLMEILVRLPSNKLVSVESVSRTWQRCVGPVLNTVETVVFESDDDRPSSEDNYSTCSHLQLSCHNRQTLHFNVSKFNGRLSRNRINDGNIDVIIQRLTRCPRVKCIDLSKVTVGQKECLMELISVFPDLTSLCLGPILASYKPVNEWRRFAEKLAPKLVYFEFCPGSRLLFDKDLSLLLTGDRLRSVHLSFGKQFRPLSMLDQLRNRPQVELSLDVDWLLSKYDFNGFSSLSFVVKGRTSARKYLFKAIENSNAAKSKTLKVKEFSSDKLFARNHLIVFKTVECLEMHCVKLDENIFKCRFERLETVQLINTSATDDAAFELLFSSMQQLKKLVVRLNDRQPTLHYFPGKSFTALKRLKCFEIEIGIKQKEQIRMTELFDALMQMSWLKCIKITCYFRDYLVVPIILKKELVFNITTLHWSLPTVKIDAELRFNKKQFDGEEAIDEVMDWYFSACHFEQISEKYTEDKNFHRVEITTSESRMSMSKVDVVTSIDNLDFHNLAL